jgi:WD40 repeat protein
VGQATGSNLGSDDIRDQAELFDLSSDTFDSSCRFPLNKFREIDLTLENRFIVSDEVSAGQKWLLAPLRYGGVRLWNLKKNEQAWELNKKEGEEKARLDPEDFLPPAPANTYRVLPSGPKMRFSPDGRWLVFATPFNNVQVRDLWSREKNKGGLFPIILRGHDQAMSDFVWSGDSRWLFTLGMDNTVRAWDMENLSESIEPREIRNPAGKGTIDISPDRHWFAVSRQDRILRFWSTTTADQTHKLSQLDKSVFASLKFSEDGKWLLAREKGQAVLWDMRATETPRKHCEIAGLHGEVGVVAVDHSGLWLAITTEEKKERAKQAGPKASASKVEASVRVWKILQGKASESGTEFGWAHRFTNDGKGIYVESLNKMDVRNIANLSERRPVHEIDQADDANQLLRVMVSPTGSSVLIFGDSDASVWFSSTNKVKSLKDSYAYPREPFFFSSDGNHIVFRDAFQQSIAIWDLKDKAAKIEPTHMPARKSAIRFLYASEDKRWLASIDGETWNLWDLNHWQGWDKPSSAKSVKQNATLVFSKDSRFAVTSEPIISGNPKETNKEIITVWDLRAGHAGIKEIRQITSPEYKGVSAVALSPAADWLAAIGGDTLIRVWDLKSKNAPTVLYGHKTIPPYELFITAGGQKVVTVDRGRDIVRVSTVSIDGFRDLAGRIVGRELRPDERKQLLLP